MEAEAKPFIDHLGLEEDASFFPDHMPFKAFAGEHGECKVRALVVDSFC